MEWDALAYSGEQLVLFSNFFALIFNNLPIAMHLFWGLLPVHKQFCDKTHLCTLQIVIDWQNVDPWQEMQISLEFPFEANKLILSLCLF